MGRQSAHAEVVSDDGYQAYLWAIGERVGKVTHGWERPVFLTDAKDLFTTYLRGIRNAATRQHYNCHACQDFLNRYGAAVVVTEGGQLEPLLWEPDDAPAELRLAVGAMARAVVKARITGPLVTSAAVLGQPRTGEWHHYHLQVPRQARHRGLLLTDHQTAAEKRQDHQNMLEALRDYPTSLLRDAVAILRGPGVDRSEKLLGAAEWLYDLAKRADATNNAERVRNVVWLAVAQAPAGFCHPRASVLGSLLEDLRGGYSPAEATTRLNAKLHPLQYQRPQAPPKEGNVERAEAIVKKLGIAKSLHRRHATLADLETVWRPVPAAARATARRPQAGRQATDSVFGGITTRQRERAQGERRNLEGGTVSWAVFARDVLPLAQRIQYLPKATLAPYFAMMTARYATAPPIIRWDGQAPGGQRNPVSWYFYVNGSFPQTWGLVAGQLVDVLAVTDSPAHWYGVRTPNEDRRVFLVLRLCRDTTSPQTMALFPEILRPELREVRATIEAYSKAHSPAMPSGQLASGVAFHQGLRLQVTTDVGSYSYTIDRLE